MSLSRETCGKLVDAATEVFHIGTAKGSLFVTDPETKSDALVGFFVPARAMIDLGRIVNQARAEAEGD